MPYNPQFHIQLQEIITLIDNNQLEEAFVRFDNYVILIQGIGPFNTTAWPPQWRKDVYTFGEKFKNINPHEFINRIQNAKVQATEEQKEALEFIRSEIIFNFLPDNDCQKEMIKLIDQFPLNPEFRHTLGHFYTKEGKYLEAVEQYQLAYKIDRNNIIFRNIRFHREQEYLNHLIEEGKYDIAKAFNHKLLKEENYIESGNNIRDCFVDFGRRINDLSLLEIKIKSLEESFKERLNKELDSERRRIIEVVGFFSAIVAFILTTVSIAKNFTFIEAIHFVIALGLILILFIVAISTLFNSHRISLLRDKKFWILVISLFLILIYLILADSFAEFLKSIIPRTQV